MNANTMNIEDVISTLDTQYRLSSYLKLRGHISYKAAKLTGQYLAKTAKLITDSEENNGIDTFNAAMGHLRGQESEDILMDEMGMTPASDMWDTIKALVMYSNKLNFDMQELVDPTAKLRADPTWKFQGVYFTEDQQRASWVSSMKLIADSDSKDALQGTYEEYSAAITNPDWLLTKEEWTSQEQDDNTLYDKYSGILVDRIMDIGPDECDFDDLPIRAQIAAIENMKGKIASTIESAMKSVKYNRTVEKHQKVAEASKVKGMIHGFNPLYCSMLDSSRYANFAEFMYSYIPTRADATPVTRKMIARNELKATDAFINGKRSDEEMAVHNDDFLDLVSDTL